jgi:hypothetical protein
MKNKKYFLAPPVIPGLTRNPLHHSKSMAQPFLNSKLETQNSKLTKPTTFYNIGHEIRKEQQAVKNHAYPDA